MCAYFPFLTDPAQCTHYNHTTEPLIASTDAATTTATEGAPVVTRPARQNSLSAETLQTLEKRLAQRPERQELEDRNILKGAQRQQSCVLLIRYLLVMRCA